MGDTMLFGVLNMPYDMAMKDEMSRRQFYSRVQEAVDRMVLAEEKVAEQKERLRIADSEMLNNTIRLSEAFAALTLIAVPKRSDGTYNRSREACELLAKDTLTNMLG